MAYHSGTAGVFRWCCGAPAILSHLCDLYLVVGIFRMWQKMLSIPNYSCSITFRTYVCSKETIAPVERRSPV